VNQKGPEVNDGLRVILVPRPIERGFHASHRAAACRWLRQCSHDDEFAAGRLIDGFQLASARGQKELWKSLPKSANVYPASIRQRSLNHEDTKGTKGKEELAVNVADPVGNGEIQAIGEAADACQVDFETSFVRFVPLWFKYVAPSDNPPHSLTSRIHHPVDCSLVGANHGRKVADFWTSHRAPRFAFCRVAKRCGRS